MIGSDAPRGRKTANRVGASKSASSCSWALARFGKVAYTYVRGDVIFVAMSFFEGETDGFEGDADGFETN
jgi:hypothetical protein